MLQASWGEVICYSRNKIHQTWCTDLKAHLCISRGASNGGTRESVSVIDLSGWEIAAYSHATEYPGSQVGQLMPKHASFKPVVFPYLIPLITSLCAQFFRGYLVDNINQSEFECSMCAWLIISMNENLSPQCV